MPKTRQQKIDKVAELTDKLNTAKSVVLADYQGLTMAQLSDIRQRLAEVSGELSVTKNNLLELSLKDAGYNVDDVAMQGPIATLFSFGDEIAPLKILTKALKDFDKGKVKVGYLNKDDLSAEQVQKLAALPSKEELRGKVVGALGGPLYGIVGVLQANVRNLVYALDQIRISKGGE